jgi:nucleoid-associated protein YgaU
MQRYIFPERILRSDTGKRFLASNVISEVLTENTFPITHIAGQNDRLDLLAHKYYGDTMKWWVIARANNLINGSIAIEPGTKLFIPRLR